MSYTQDVYMSQGTEYIRHVQHCNVVALYIDGCLGFHDILVYWNGSTLYNFRMSNCVQQRKTYTRKAATVHLNCSTVPCNTSCARKQRPCDVKGVTSFVTYRVSDLGMQYPGVRHTHVNISGGTTTHHQNCKQLSTASGICYTVTATYCYRGRVGNGLSVLWVTYATHNTLKPVPTLLR
jgi:hypothetical protein